MAATTISPYPGTVNKSITNNMLEIPQGDRVMVEYVWIDGTGEAMRSKCKTLEFVPKEAKGKLKKASKLYMSRDMSKPTK